MNCRQARRRLTAGRATGGAARRHVEECASCRRFARRLAAVERALGERPATTLPPAGFAARVQARLPREEDAIGWAALRLLPLTLALVALLGWLNLRGDEPAGSVDPTDAVLTWVLDPAASSGSATDPGNGS